jgi:hypothetical protein
MGGHLAWLFKPAFMLALLLKIAFMCPLASAANYECLDKEENRPVALSGWMPAIHYEYSSYSRPSYLSKRLISSLIWRGSHPMACPAHGNVPAQADGDLYRKSCFLYRSRLICIENRVFYTGHSPESASHDPAQPA